MIFLLLPPFAHLKRNTEESFTYLSFYTESYDEMVPVGRAILPVSDSGNPRFPAASERLYGRDLGANGKVFSQWTAQDSPRISKKPSPQPYRSSIG